MEGSDLKPPKRAHTIPCCPHRPDFLHRNQSKQMSTKSPNHPNPSVPELPYFPISCRSPSALLPRNSHPTPTFLPNCPKSPLSRVMAPCPHVLFKARHIQVPTSSSIHLTCCTVLPHPKFLTHAPPWHHCCCYWLDNNIPATFLSGITSHYCHFSWSPSWLPLHDILSLASFRKASCRLCLSKICL